MFSNPYLLVASFLIGSFGSCSYLFLLWGGFKEVPAFTGKKLLSGENLFAIFIYIFIGGGIALILQIDSETWSAFYALMLGLSWPGMIAGYLGAKETKDLKNKGKKQIDYMALLTKEGKELNELLAPLTGEEEGGA